MPPRKRKNENKPRKKTPKPPNQRTAVAQLDAVCAALQPSVKVPGVKVTRENVAKVASDVADALKLANVELSAVKTILATKGYLT